MWNNRLIGLYFIFSLFIHVVISGEETVIKWIRPHWLTSHRVFGYQAVRHIRSCPACPNRIHPLGPHFIKRVKTVQFPIVDGAATSFIFCRLIHIHRHCQDNLTVKLPVCQIPGLFQYLQIDQLLIQIQFIDDITISISLIQHITPPLHVIRSFKDYFMHPVTLIYDLDPFAWIPFQNGIFAYCSVYGHFEGPISNVQDLF